VHPSAVSQPRTVVPPPVRAPVMPRRAGNREGLRAVFPTCRCSRKHLAPDASAPQREAGTPPPPPMPVGRLRRRQARRAPKGGASPLPQPLQCERLLGLKRHPAHRGAVEGPNVLVEATASRSGWISELLSPGPDGPSPVGRCRPSSPFSSPSAQETENADVMLMLAAFFSKPLFFFSVLNSRNGFDL
jgi:hypothetical protein